MTFTSGTLTADERKRRANRPGGGPYSRRIAKGLIDGRGEIGRIARHVRHDLTQEIGGEPSFSQRMLIEQITMNAVLLSQWAERIQAGTVVGEQHAHDRYLAASNSFRLGLEALGVEAKAKDKTSDLFAAFDNMTGRR